MADSRYRLRLGEATLVFFPPQVRDGQYLHDSYVVQVMMRTETSSPTREEVAAYCNAQEEITAAVEAILIEDIISPLRRVIEIEGDGYLLVGEKMEWSYGKSLAPRWGDDAVRAWTDKWVFRFRTCDYGG
ncbi:hypothetical protein B0H11DRAFT_2241554 [Mycena galericulata]|nr:hypothetical protein B0H11DRAFT_2241554 [Mycena galericulata]